MAYERIQEPQWQTFCALVSKVLANQPIDFEVIGLDTGDQISSWLTLSAISYDPINHSVHVLAEAGRGLHLDHAILVPKELYAEIGEAGLTQIIVIDADERRHFMRLRQVLILPPDSEELS